MSDAEITAYLIGAEIGRRAVANDPAGASGNEPVALAADPDGLESYRRLGSATFKSWVLRGVQDAIGSGPALS